MTFYPQGYGFLNVYLNRFAKLFDSGRVNVFIKNNTFRHMLSFCMIISLGSKDNKIYLLCYIFINIFTYRDKICREFYH